MSAQQRVKQGSQVRRGLLSAIGGQTFPTGAGQRLALDDGMGGEDR